jgi:hypothetical protein
MKYARYPNHYHSPEIKAALSEIIISADSLVAKAIEDYIFTHNFHALRSYLM